MVGTIHRTNVRSTNYPTATGTTEIVEIQDNEDGTNVLTAQISSVLQAVAVVGDSGSNPVSGPTANLTQPRAE
jgi:hypothetical protein